MSTFSQHLVNVCGFQGSFSWASIQCRLCYEVQFFTRPEPREFSWNDPDIDDSNLWLGRFCNLQSRWKLNEQYAYQSTAANSQWVSIVAPDVTSKSCTEKISRKHWFEISTHIFIHHAFQLTSTLADIYFTGASWFITSHMSWKRSSTLQVYSW